MLKSWLTNLLTNGTLAALTFLTGIILARELGPNDRGLLAELLFWPPIIAASFSLSLSDFLIWSNQNQSTIIRPQLIRITCILCIICTLICLLNPLSRYTDIVSFPLFLLFILICIPSHLFGLLVQASFMAELEFVRLSRFRILRAGLYLLGIGAFLILDELSVIATLGAFALAQSIPLLLSRSKAPCSTTEKTESDLLIISRSWKFHKTYLLNILSSHIDRFAIMLFFAPTQIGLYIVAWGLAAAAIGPIVQSLHTTLFPTLANTPKGPEKIHAFVTGISWSCIILSLVTIFITIISPYIIPLLFGNDYIASVSVSCILFAAHAIQGWRQIMTRCLRTFDNSTIAYKAEIVTIVAFSIMYLLFLPDDLQTLSLLALFANLKGSIFIMLSTARAFAVPAYCFIFPKIPYINHNTTPLITPRKNSR